MPDFSRDNPVFSLLNQRCLRPLFSALAKACRAAALGLSLLMPVLVPLYLSLPAYGEDQGEDQAEEPMAEQAQASEAREANKGGKDLPAQAENSERILPDSWGNQLSGVSQHLALFDRSDEHIELVAAEQAFSGYFIQQRSHQAQGGVLILGDRQQHSLWPSGSGALREHLPDYGWATLAIELPLTPQPALPPRDSINPEESSNKESGNKITLNGEAAKGLSTAATDPTTAADPSAENPETSEGAADNAQDKEDNGINDINADDVDTSDADTSLADNEPPLPRLNGLPAIPQADSPPSTQEPPKPDAIDLYRQQTQARIRAALLYLNQRGMLNIVIIAQGQSASWALDAAAEQAQGERGLSVILLDAIPDPNNPQTLRQQLSQLSLPLLDLISQQGRQQLNRQQLQRRAGGMRHRGMSAYQQIQLENYALNSGAFPQPGNAMYDAQYNPVLRRIRGWLRSNAAGTALTRR